MPDPFPPSTTEAVSGQFAFPVDRPKHVNSPFGMRTHPVSGKQKMHRGVDYRAPEGTKIKAAAAGEVVFSGWQSGYGNIVIVKHAGDLFTAYAHLSKRQAKVGNKLEAGQQLGLSGHTGIGTGAHLHFEVRKGKNDKYHAVNPETFKFGASPVTGESPMADDDDHDHAAASRQPTSSATHPARQSQRTAATGHAQGPQHGPSQTPREDGPKPEIHLPYDPSSSSRAEDPLPVIMRDDEGTAKWSNLWGSLATSLKVAEATFRAHAGTRSPTQSVFAPRAG